MGLFVSCDGKWISKDKSGGKMAKRYRKRLYLEVGVKVISGVTEGHVASDIVAKANEIDADLIYIPVTRKNVVQLTLLGSTSRDVMRLTDKPTFVHKTRPKLVEEKPIENMMFATDFSKGTEKAKERLKDYSRAAKNLILIYVGRRAADPMSEHKRRGVVNNKLGELNEELTPYFESIKTVNEIGTPYKVILSYSSKMDVDLVVLGKFTRRSVSKFTGSTAENVIHKAESSILLVP